MGKELFKKVMSLCVVTLFVISFAVAAVAGEEAKDVQNIKGKISSIDAETGRIMVKDEYGIEMSLKAGPDIDLKSVSEGDQVSIESTSDGAVKSIAREESTP